MAKKQTKNRFKGKKFVGNITVNRLPVFSAIKTTSTISTKYGTCSTNLNQKHKDILDAIMVCKKQWIEYETIATKSGEIYVSMGFIFKVKDVLKFLNAGENYTWFRNKLDEIQNSQITITSKNFKIKFNIIGGIFEVYNEEEPKKDWLLQEPKYMLITFTNEFSHFVLNDYRLYLTVNVAKAITDLKHSFLKALVRFCITHEELNMKFDDILTCLGYSNIDKRHKSKLKNLLLLHAEYLSKNFNIHIKINDNIIIFYSKKPTQIAIDYEQIK